MKLDLTPERAYKGPPPQCVDCSKFVKVETAQPLHEFGEFGVILSTEFRCARCCTKRQRVSREAV